MSPARGARSTSAARSPCPGRAALTGTHHRTARAAATALLALAVLAFSASAQGRNAGDGLRLGVSVGGISTFGVLVEWFSDTHAVELGLGTWAFGEVSLSVVYKEYFFASRVRPFVGAGLWTVVAPGEQLGVALMARVPVGADWAFVDDHALGAALSLNRALAVRRTDPEDQVPPVGRIVPLPEVYYRLTP